MRMRLNVKTILALILSLVISLSNLTALAKASDVNGSTASTSSAVLDQIMFGDSSSETSHSFNGAYTTVINGVKGDSARVALPSPDNAYLGGDLTFTLKIDPDMQNYFTLKTWGSDLGYGVSMLYVNGERLAIQHEGDWQPLYKTMNSDAFGLHPIIPDQFSYSTINLPLELTKGKTELSLMIRTTAEFYPYGMGDFNAFYRDKFTGRKSKAFYAGYTTVTSSLPEGMLEKGTLDTSAIVPRDGTDLDSQSAAAVAFANNFITSAQSFVNGYLNDNTKFFSNVAGNDLQTMQIRTFSDYLKDENRAYASYGFTPQTSNEVRDKMLDRIRLGMDQYVAYYLNDPAELVKPHQAVWGGFFKYGGEALWTVYNLFQSEDSVGLQGLFGSAYLTTDGTSYVPKYRVNNTDRANGITSSFQKWLKGSEEVDWSSVAIGSVNAGGTAKNGAFSFTNADPILYTAKFAQTGINADLNVVTHTKRTTRFVAWQELFFMNLSYARTHSSLGNYLTNQNEFQKFGMFKSNLALLALGSPMAENYNSSLRYLYEGAGITPWLGHDIVNGLVELNDNNSGDTLVVNNLAAFNDAAQFDGNRNYIGQNAMQWGDRYLNISEAGMSREPQYAAHYGEHTDLVQEEWRETHDDKLLKKALEISSARANMRYQGLDDSKNRSMHVEGVIESRGPNIPGDLAYQSVQDEEKQLIYVGFERYLKDHADRYAGAEWDKYKQYASNAVGYAQQMLLDHFFLNDPAASSPNVRDQNLLQDYLYAANPTNWKGVLLPMSNTDWLLPSERGDGKQQGTYSQDYISSMQQHGFVDIDNGLVAARDGSNVMFISFTRRSNPGLNGLARMHVVTPDNDVMLSLAPNVQYEPSGYWNTKPNWAQFDTAYDKNTPPIDGARLAVAGDILPIPEQAIEKGRTFTILPTKTGSAYSGNAQFYSVQYGKYMIALNHTTERSGDAKVYDVILPSSYTGGTVYDVISKQYLPVKAGNKVAVVPGSAVVLRVTDVNDVPDSSIFVTATASNGKAALSWFHAAGTTGHYDILRSDNSGSTYNVVAQVDKNSNHYLDTNVQNGKTYYYKVRGVTSSGVTGYDSVYAKVQVASGAIDGTWSAANIDGVATGLSVAAGANGVIAITGEGTIKTINLVDQISIDSKDSSKSMNEALPDYAFAYRTNFVQGVNGATSDFAFSAKVSSGNTLGNTGIMIKEVANGQLVTDTRGLLFSVDANGNYYLTSRQYPNVIPIYDFLADGYNVYNSYMPPAVRGTASIKSVDGSYYLKVVRQGQYVYPSISADGATWEKLQEIWVPMADSLYVGVATAKSAQFSDIQLTAAAVVVGPGKVYPAYKTMNDKVNLNWQFPRGATNFNVYRTFDEAASHTDPALNPGTSSKWSLIAQHSTGSQYTDSGLSTTKTIYYKVVAFDSAGVSGEFSDLVTVSGGVGVSPANASGVVPVSNPWKEAGWNEFQYSATTVDTNKVTLSSQGEGVLINATDEYNKYRLAYQEIDPTQNYTFITKLPTSIYNSTLKIGSRIGLMLRNSLDNYSKYAINAVATGDTWIQSGFNKSDSGLAFDMASTGKVATGDVWLKIALNGGNYSAYYSLAPANTYESLGGAKVQETVYPTSWTQIGTTKALDLAYKDASGTTQTRSKMYAGLVLGNRTTLGSVNYLYTSPVFAVPDITIAPGNGDSPATLTGKSDLTVSVGDTVSFHVAATDAFGGSNIQEIQTQLPAGATFDTATSNVVFMPTANNLGNNSLVFTTKDATDTNSFVGSLGINVKVYNDATKVPILDPLGNKSVIGGNALSFAVRASLEDVTSLSAGASAGSASIDYSIDSVVKSGAAMDPAELGMSLANGIFSWNPSADAGGIYEVTFKSQTTDASDVQKINITVMGKPVVTVPDRPLTFKTNEKGTYLINAFDPAGLNLVNTVANLPVGASFDAATGVLAWTPTKDQRSDTADNTYRIDLTADNGLFKVTKSINIYVSFQNKAPSFLPVVDFQQIQYTQSANSASAGINSTGTLNSTTGTISLTMDLTNANWVHEQHPFFYYVPLYDGGEVVAHLTDGVNAAYSGVMVAEDVNDDAPRFLMNGLTTDAANADWGTFKVAAPYRSVKGTTVSPNKDIFDGGGDVAYLKGKTPPYWMRIVRAGDQIHGYVQNADGSWGDGRGASTPLRTLSFSGILNDAAVYAGVGMTGAKLPWLPVRNNWSAQFDSFSLPNYPIPVTEGVPVFFPVRIADADQDTVAVSIAENDLPTGALYELKDGQFTWNNPRMGTYHVTFHANDGTEDAQPMTIVLKVKQSNTVDKSALQQLITDARARVNGDDSYTDSSLAALLNAIDHATAALSTIDSYTALDAEMATLQQAINALVIQANRAPFFLPIVDFKQIQYTQSANSASEGIVSKGFLDRATGNMKLNMDLTNATWVHEQHPFFSYIPLYDGGEMVTRITDAANAGYSGVMVAEDVNDDAPRFLMVGLTTDAASADWGIYKVAAPYRDVKGGGPNKGIFDGAGDTILKGKTTPFLVKIVRNGDQIKGYVQNADGSWGDGKGANTPLRTVSFNGVSNDTALYAGVGMTGLKLPWVTVNNNWSAQFDSFSLPNYTLPVMEAVPVSFPVKTVDLDHHDTVAVTIPGNNLPASAKFELIDGQFTWGNPRAGTYQITFAANDGNVDAEPMTIIFKVKANSVVDKWELQQLITAAQAISNQEGKYTTESYAALQNAIGKAQAALDTIISYSVLDSEVMALQQGIDDLALTLPKNNVESVSLTQMGTVLTVGDALTLVATINPGNAANKTVSFTTSNPDVASVTSATYNAENGTTSVIVNALSAGTVKITAITEDGGKTAERSFAIVSPSVEPADTPVMNVSINPSESLLTVGDTVTLAATVNPDNATNKAVSFITSNSSVASVTNATYDPDNGTTSVIVTALSMGSADITAITMDGGKTAIRSFTVISPPDITAPGEVTNAAVVAGDGQLKIIWNDPLNNDLASIGIYGAGSTVITPITVSKSVYAVTITGLTNGMTYSFKVKTKDTAGNESTGVTVSGTPVHVSSGSTNPQSSGQTPPPSQPAVTVMQGSVTVKAAADDKGIISVSVDAKAIREAMEGSTDKTVTIIVQPLKDVKEVKVEVSLDQMLSLDNSKLNTLKVDTGLAVISIDKQLFGYNSGTQESKIQLSVTTVDKSALPADVRAQLGGSEVYDFNLTIDGNKVSRFNGKGVKVALNYSLKPGENPNNIVIYYMDDNGKLEVVKNGKYNKDNGKVEFKPKHFSKYAAFSTGITFKDLNRVSWALESIEALASRGIIQGVGSGNFSPDGNVTRAEFITMMMNALDEVDVKAKTALQDVKAGAWYYNAIASAEQLGIVNGKTDGFFGVEDTVTRQDMAVMIYRALQLTNNKLDKKNDAVAFVDQSTINGYAIDAVEAMHKAGIIEGIGEGQFAPHAQTTRAQAAVIIYRLF